MSIDSTIRFSVERRMVNRPANQSSQPPPLETLDSRGAPSESFQEFANRGRETIRLQEGHRLDRGVPG